MRSRLSNPQRPAHINGTLLIKKLCDLSLKLTLYFVCHPPKKKKTVAVILCGWVGSRIFISARLTHILILCFNVYLRGKFTIYITLSVREMGFFWCDLWLHEFYSSKFNNFILTKSVLSYFAVNTKKKILDDTCHLISSKIYIMRSV